MFFFLVIIISRSVQHMATMEKPKPKLHFHFHGDRHFLIKLFSPFCYISHNKHVCCISAFQLAPTTCLVWGYLIKELSLSTLLLNFFNNKNKKVTNLLNQGKKKETLTGILIVVVLKRFDLIFKSQTNKQTSTTQTDSLVLGFNGGFFLFVFDY